MLEALRRCWGWLAPRLRRALTFWRRSIQARVVASTVVLSAVVVSGVGWILLQQTRDGLLRHRSEVVLGEVDAEVADAQDRLEAASGREVNASQQQRDLVDPIIERGASRGYAVVLAGPEGEDPALRTGGGEYTSGLDLISIPPPSRSTSTPRAGRRRGPTPRSCARRAPAPTRGPPGSRGSWSAPRSSCPRTARPTRSTSCSRSPRSRTPSTW
ncbi:hypothetical protein [Nocardioides kongjuensis]|uniref:hypothetical protein n=1 Tax=Nocardioides kongjuensis TaxID=349522 RepID=UPI0031EC3E98